MPKIAKFEDTPNSGALKFTLRELLTWRITRLYDNPDQALRAGFFTLAREV